MVHPEEFESPAFGSVDQRSIQLSYGCIVFRDTNDADKRRLFLTASPSATDSLIIIYQKTYKVNCFSHFAKNTASKKRLPTQTVFSKCNDIRIAERRTTFADCRLRQLLLRLSPRHSGWLCRVKACEIRSHRF